MGMRHGGFISSGGADGWYQTVEEDEVITFKYPVNALLLETLSPLTVQINGKKGKKSDENLWHIGEELREGIEGFKISSIMVHGEAGQPIKWKGLIA